MSDTKERIKVGDFVDVFWEYIEPLFNVRATHIPTDVGDSWHLYQEETKTAHAVIFYSRMNRVWSKP